MEKETNQELEWLEAQKIEISVDLFAAAKQQLQFLQVIDRNRWLYDGPALDKAIYRYNAYWLPLLAKYNESSSICQGPLVPPLDCEWVWHCHRLNPVRYKSDCEQFYGRVLDNFGVVSSVNGNCKLQTEAIWKTLYPLEPFDIDLDKEISKTSLDKFTTYDLVSAVKRQSPFYYQKISNNSVTARGKQVSDLVDTSIALSGETPTVVEVASVSCSLPVQSTEDVPLSISHKIANETTIISQVDPSMIETASVNDAPLVLTKIASTDDAPLTVTKTAPVIVAACKDVPPNLTDNVSTLVVAQESYGIGDTSDVRASKTEALFKDVLGNNQFASLDSSECISSDDDEYLCDVEMTASAQRILRDRPVKPSKKVEEMLNISSNAGGRGNRGRKGRRGRGNIG